MTPAEFSEIVKAFGVPGGILLAIVWAIVTRKGEPPGPSRLEQDVAALREEVHEIKERLARWEGRMEGKR